MLTRAADILKTQRPSLLHFCLIIGLFCLIIGALVWRQGTEDYSTSVQKTQIFYLVNNLLSFALKQAPQSPSQNPFEVSLVHITKSLHHPSSIISFISHHLLHITSSLTYHIISYISHHLHHQSSIITAHLDRLSICHIIIHAMSHHHTYYVTPPIFHHHRALGPFKYMCM